MRQFYLAPFVIAAVLGCGDSTSPNSSQTSNTVLANLGSMNVGDVRVMTFAQAQGGLTIPSAEASAVYAIITANVAGDIGSVPQYTLLGNRSGGTPALGTVKSVASPMLRPRYTRVGGRIGAQFEAKLRAYERSHIPRFMALAQSQPRRAVSPLLRKDNVPVGTVPAVGSTYQFNVPGAGTDACSPFTTVSAKVEAVSQHAIIVTDTRALNDGFTTASYDSIANEFDTYIYPTEAGYFGTPTDIDHNGHIYILFTPAVNELTPPGAASTEGFVGGFTFAGDFLPATSESLGGCPESNLAEIFYLMVPDSTAGGGNQYGNTFSTDFVRQQTRVTMAHEFQHAINAGRRIANNYPLVESAWLDEALSSLGEDVVGRAEVGLMDLQTITLAAAENMDPTLFNTFFLTNLARTQSYVLRPDTIGALVTDAREEQDVAAFGAGWAFLRYVVDWYSGNSPRVLTTNLVAGPDTGTKNLTTQAGATLDTLLAHWLITMYTDGQLIPGLPAQYNYRSYNMRDIVSALCPNANGCTNSSVTYQTYLPIDTIGTGTGSFAIGIPSSSADYFITSKSTGGARTVQIDNSGGATAATYPYGRVYVVRLE